MFFLEKRTTKKLKYKRRETSRLVLLKKKDPRTQFRWVLMIFLGIVAGNIVMKRANKKYYSVKRLLK
jgi:hypothetical protein